MDIIISSKICNKCKIDKKLSDFRRCKTGKFGRHNFCKICHSETNKERYNNKREEIIDKQLQWNAAHPDKTKRYQKKYNKKIQKEEKENPPEI